MPASALSQRRHDVSHEHGPHACVSWPQTTRTREVVRGRRPRGTARKREVFRGRGSRGPRGNGRFFVAADHADKRARRYAWAGLTLKDAGSGNPDEILSGNSDHLPVALSGHTIVGDSASDEGKDDRDAQTTRDSSTGAELRRPRFRASGTVSHVRMMRSTTCPSYFTVPGRGLASIACVCAPPKNNPFSLMPC